MIVIPMAGLSSRFQKAGYDVPTYMLHLTDGRSTFAHAIASFASCFATHPFLFIARDIYDTAAFVNREVANLGIAHARTLLLDRPTAGQAETVELGLRAIAHTDVEPVTIFNIDTFRPGFAFPPAEWFARSDGYLEVFTGTGTNWSFVRASGGSEPLVVETAEKRPISELCCTGLYHFARVVDFMRALDAERASPSGPELYVAPIYNHLIRAGKRIHYSVIESSDVVFCGVPQEYEDLLARRWTGPGMDLAASVTGSNR